MKCKTFIFYCQTFYLVVLKTKIASLCFKIKSCFTQLVLRYSVKKIKCTHLYFVVLSTEKRCQFIYDIHKLLRIKYKNYYKKTGH